MQFIYCCRYKFDKLNVVAFFYGIVYNHPKNAETFREIHRYIVVVVISIARLAQARLK